MTALDTMSPLSGHSAPGDTLNPNTLECPSVDSAGRPHRSRSAPPQQTPEDPSAVEGDPRKYRRIGRWYIGETLGKGGYGWVKKGFDCSNGKPVALKFMLRAEESWRDVQKRQIASEIEALRRVRHRNVIRLLAYNVDAEYPQKNGEVIRVVLLVLEFAAGGELYDILFYTHQLHEEVARTYFVQLIDAIDACHQQNVIHRDIKPQNLLLDHKYRLRLADFGLGKIFSNEDPEAKGINVRQLQTHFVGTKGYRAPELVSKRRYNNGVDIFAAGVVLFIFLNGYPPFVDTKRSDRWYRRIREEDYDEFWRLHRSCPVITGRMTHAQNLLIRMLEYNPDKRITIADIRQHPWIANQSVFRTNDLRRIVRRLHLRTEKKRRANPEATAYLQESMANKDKQRRSAELRLPIPANIIRKRQDTLFTSNTTAGISEGLKKMQIQQGFTTTEDVIEIQHSNRHRRVASKRTHQREMSTSHGILSVHHIDPPPRVPMDFVEHCRDVRSDLNYQTLLACMYEQFVGHGCRVVFDMEEYKFLVTTKFIARESKRSKPIIVQFSVQFWLESNPTETSAVPRSSQGRPSGNALELPSMGSMFGAVVYDEEGAPCVQHTVVRFKRVSGDPLDWFKINHVYDQLCGDLFVTREDDDDEDDDLDSGEDLDALPSDIPLVTLGDESQESDSDAYDDDEYDLNDSFC